jgi:hypothetical protein
MGSSPGRLMRWHPCRSLFGSGRGRNPATVRFKAACRAARRPGPPISTTPGRRLRKGSKALLVGNPPPLVLASPDLEAPV